jgi:8-oxo-dGTP diphosphatase
VAGECVLNINSNSNMSISSTIVGMKKGTDYTGVTIVFACHDGNGKYLFSKRSKNCRDEQETWDLGGGGLEFDDTVEGTLQKEIKEEYCAEVINFEFLGYRDVHRENDAVKTHWIALDFKVQIDPAMAKIGEPHKIDELLWCSLNEAPRPLHSQLPTFLKKYEDKLG